MEGEDPGENPGESKKRPFLDRFSLTNLWRVLVVAALGLTAGFGGLEKADPATPIVLGQTYDNGPLRITPISLRALCMPDDSAFLQSQSRFVKRSGTTDTVIALDTKVQNRSDHDVPLDRRKDTRDEPVYEDVNRKLFGSSSVEIYDPSSANIFELARPPQYTYGTGFLSTQMPNEVVGPGITRSVTFFWGFPRGALGDDGVAVIRIFHIEQREKSLGEMVWQHVEPRAPYGELRGTIRECSS